MKYDLIYYLWQDYLLLIIIIKFPKAPTRDLASQILVAGYLIKANNWCMATSRQQEGYVWNQTMLKKRDSSFNERVWERVQQSLRKTGIRKALLFITQKRRVSRTKRLAGHDMHRPFSSGKRSSLRGKQKNFIRFRKCHFTMKKTSCSNEI